MFNPKHLNRWTLPPSYAGAQWPDYYVFLAQNRDSDALTRSNFKCGLAAIGGETGEDDDGTSAVTVVRESHWACDWVEWIAIHQTNTTALEKADAIAADLENYPVVDENDYSETESADADETWKNCYDARERIAYIRDHRSQFDFHDFADLLACVRGNYFAGYASELLA